LTVRSVSSKLQLKIKGGSPQRIEASKADSDLLSACEDTLGIYATQYLLLFLLHNEKEEVCDAILIFIVLMVRVRLGSL